MSSQQQQQYNYNQGKGGMLNSPNNINKNITNNEQDRNNPVSPYQNIVSNNKQNKIGEVIGGQQSRSVRKRTGGNDTSLRVSHDISKSLSYKN